MNFEHTEEQRQLADSLGKYLAAHYGFEQRELIIHSASGFGDAAWAAFAEMGLTAIALPEADGGFGGGALDLMPVMEACGAALVVEPLLDHIALGARLLARAGSAAQRAAWLPGAIDGSVRLAFAGLQAGAALRPRAGNDDAEAQRIGRGAERPQVGGDRAPSATRIVVSARRAARASCSSTRRSAACRSRPAAIDGQRAADITFTKWRSAATRCSMRRGRKRCR
ncbi:MAG: acyl-CoA dehydrogenase family protein [Rubrivivax sp.]